MINPFGKYIQMTKKMIELLINGYEYYENERKNKDDEESKEFYYLGPIHSTGQENAKEISMANGTAAVELEYVLEVPVRDDIYDYIVNG